MKKFMKKWGHLFGPARLVNMAAREAEPGSFEYVPEKVSKKQYREKYEQTMDFLDGLIDGKGMTDMNLNALQRKHMEAVAKKARIEMLNLPDPRVVEHNASPYSREVRLKDNYRKIVEIMMYYYAPERKSTKDRIRMALFGERPEWHENYKVFEEQRYAAERSIEEAILYLYKKGETEGPQVDVLRRFLGNIGKLEIKTRGDLEQKNKKLDRLLRALARSLDEKIASGEIKRKNRFVFERLNYELHEKLGMEKLDYFKAQKAVRDACARAVDMIKGRYRYKVNGRMRDLPGNIRGGKDDPKTLLRLVKQQMDNASNPEMNAIRAGTEWTVRYGGFAFSVKKLLDKDVIGRDEYDVELIGVNSVNARRFDKIAAYARRKGRQRDLTASN